MCAGELGMVDEAPAALSQSQEASTALLSSLEAASAIVPVQPQACVPDPALSAFYAAAVSATLLLCNVLSCSSAESFQACTCRCS